jgi:hypothetical protein
VLKEDKVPSLQRDWTLTRGRRGVNKTILDGLVDYTAGSTTRDDRKIVRSVDLFHGISRFANAIPPRTWTPMPPFGGRVGVCVNESIHSRQLPA